MFLYVIFNNLASFSFITDIKLLYIPVNYGKLMFLTNVKATPTVTLVSLQYQTTSPAKLIMLDSYQSDQSATGTAI